MSTELEQRGGAELSPADEQVLAAAAIEEIDSSDLRLPDIKILQQMSNEVAKEGEQAGTFLNTITGENYGSELEFVTVKYVKGRFYVADRDTPDERTYVATGPVAPDNWPEEYAGKPFAEIAEAEEEWRRRSNDKTDPLEWGKGPPIVTTHNFIGFVVPEDEDGALVPARLRLNRTSAPAAQKILSILRWSNRAAWATTFKIKLLADEKGGKVYYRASAAQGGQTASELVESAKQLAHTIQSASAFGLVGDPVDEEKPAEPGAVADAVPEGGIKV